MLKHIEIQGYRSLKDVSLDMEPLNVLIGPNGGGKSNFMDLFRLLKAGAHGELAEAVARRGGLRNVVFRGQTGDYPGISLLFEFAGAGAFCRPVRYVVQLLGAPLIGNEAASERRANADAPLLRREDPFSPAMLANSLQEDRLEEVHLKSDEELAISQVRDPHRYPTLDGILWNLSNWAIYPPIDVSPDSAIRRPQTTRSGMRVFRKCENTVAVLNAIGQMRPDVWGEMLDVLKVACPDLRDVRFPPQGGDGKVFLSWFEKPFENEAGFSPEHLSDGIMRMLALVAILMTPDPPPLICVDEPEIGLHPELVELVAELLQSAATRTQLVVATHSPELVSKLKPNEVVVVEKEDGATVMERLSEEELAVWLDKFRLGDLWTSGHIGGRP